MSVPITPLHGSGPSGSATALVIASLLITHLVIPAPASAELCHSPGSTVTVLLNWDTFEDQGFLSSWQPRVGDSVVRAYTRWSYFTGLNLAFKYGGLTTKEVGGTGEIVVKATEAPGDPNVPKLASAGCRYINIHRRELVGGTAIPWTVWMSPAAGTVDMAAVLQHEFGHSIAGIWNHINDSRATMQPGYNWNAARWGPYPLDRDAVLSEYGVSPGHRLYLTRTVDNGQSWTSVSSNLPSSSPRTTARPALIRDGSNLIAFLTHTNPSTQNRVPMWLKGNTSGTFSSATVFGGLRSQFGVGAAGRSGKYLWTWVDETGADMNVRVVRTTDGGASWVYANPPAGTRAAGTPGVCYLGGSTWVLAYAAFDWTNPAIGGIIQARVSTNDGASWGPPSSYPSSADITADEGVSCAADANGNIRIAYSFAPASISNLYLSQSVRVRTIYGSVTGSSIAWQQINSVTNYGWTRTSPSISASSQGFLLGYRGTNALSSFHSSFQTHGSVSWPSTTVLASTMRADVAVGADVTLPWMFALEVR